MYKSGNWVHEQGDLGLLGPFPCVAFPVALLFVFVLRLLPILCSTKCQLKLTINFLGIGIE